MKKITEITKRDIIELLVDGKEMVFDKYYLPLYGRLDELSFLKRIYNLSSMPSNDGRFTTAEGDIIQHTINNYDWDNDWVFYDERFGLKSGDDEVFLNFLCENFHPAVRKEKGNWREFLSDINELLAHDGYEIFEVNTISGRSVYGFKEINTPIKIQPLKKGSVINGIFDNYTIIKQFNQGGSAKILEVKDSNEEIYALKTITHDSKTPSDKIKRFKNEYKFLFKQDHPNIVKVTDYGVTSDQKTLFYVMPKYDSDLRDLINSGIEPNKIIKYFLQISEGLKHAHNKKCWHRDLKPENILYDREKDSLVVADFGIAHFQEQDKSTKVLTKETDRLANFDYHAPEQRKGMVVDRPSADIWALGLILNEMFTKELAKGIDFKKIKNVCDEYKALDDLVNCMLKNDIEERSQSIFEVQIQFISSLSNKQINNYPEFLYGIFDFLIYPRKEELEMFVSNEPHRVTTINSIENLIKLGITSVYPAYISFLMKVIEYIYSTRSVFEEYSKILNVLLNILESTSFVQSPLIFRIFIAEEFNNIAHYIGEKNSMKNLGKAWGATNTWYLKNKDIPQENIDELLLVSSNNNLFYLKKLIESTFK